MEDAVGNVLLVLELLVLVELDLDVGVPAIRPDQGGAVVRGLEVGEGTGVGDLAGLGVAELGRGDQALGDPQRRRVAAHFLAGGPEAADGFGGCVRGQIGDEQHAVEALGGRLCGAR